VEDRFVVEESHKYDENGGWLGMDCQPI